jgi:hypothetical protein
MTCSIFVEKRKEKKYQFNQLYFLKSTFKGQMKEWRGKQREAE